LKALDDNEELTLCDCLYSDCREKAIGAKVRDPETAIKLWEVSAKLVGLADWDPFTADDKTPRTM
jgi:hypothetical protein